MTVVIENLGGIKRQIQLTIPVESIRLEKQKRFKDLTHKVKIDGFRRGKVPMKIIENRYGDAVYSEALNDLIHDAYTHALKEANIVPAGSPKITPKEDKIDQEKSFEFTATFDVFPEIALQSFASLTVEKPAAHVEEADVDKAIERVREQRATSADNGEKHLPELTEDFIQTLGIKGGLDALKKEVRKNLERELKYALKNKLKTNVIEALVALHVFDVPEALVMQEAERMREDSKRYFKQMGAAMKLPELPLDLFKEKALNRVRVGLLFSEILEKMKIEPTQAAIDERIADMATMYDDAERAIQWISNDKRQMEDIRAQVREDALIEQVLKEASVVEKAMTYEEVMQQGRG